MLGGSVVHLGIGDPDLLGWSITLGYLSGAALSFVRARQYAGSGAGRHEMFWFLIAVFLFLMGLNKQLDLQTAVIEIGREATMQLGWYEYRRQIAIGFISLLFAWGAVSQAWLYSVLTRFDRREKLALLGLSVLFVFIAVRAAYFQHIDFFTNYDAILARRIHWMMEITGILCITIATCYGKLKPIPEPVKLLAGSQHYPE